MMAAEHLLSLGDHALQYAGIGLQVFPVSPADKAPLTTHGMNEATSDIDQVRRWWQQHPDALIGCRIPENLVVLDIDPRYGGADTWQLLEQSYSVVPTARMHASGRGDGGHHRWFVRPAGKLSIRNLNEWARRNGVGQSAGKRSWTSGIDILHHNHRYTILPPSPHPDTHKPYVWLREQKSEPMPGFLAELVTAPPASPPPPRSLRIADENSIADWFSANHSWADILGPLGWLRVSGDGDSDGSQWRHPNASAKHSATIKHGCMFVYTPNTDFDQTEQGDPRGYTRFRAWAIVEHDGDLKIAARAAYELRDGPRDPDPIRNSVGVTMPIDPASPWEDPIPIGGGFDALPRFPVHVLPSWILDHVNQVAAELQVPVDLPAGLALVALSTVAAKRAEVWTTRSWREQLCLYVVVAMPPGAGKSPAFTQMLGPLERLERDLIDAARPRIEEQATRRAIVEKLQRKAIDKGETAEALSYGDDLRLMGVEVEPRLFVDDVTVEKLGEMLRDQQGRLALVSTEGGLFDQMIGRYSEKVKASLDPYLMMWSGDTVRVDRIGRGSIVIDKPALTIGVTVQPTVLEALAERPELKGRGLTARFMYSVPQSNVGYRDMATEPCLDPRVTERYCDHLAHLWHRLVGLLTPERLEFSPEAKATFVAWRQQMETERRPSGSLIGLTEWSTKVESSVIRVAGLLHLAAGHGQDDDIELTTLDAALEVGTYWIAHAHAVHEMWGADPVAAVARKILEWVANGALDEFSVRDCYTANRTAMPRAEDALEPLGLLIERGWVRPLNVGPLSVGRRGHPSPRFAVHPDLSTHIRNGHVFMRVMCLETLKNGLSPSQFQDLNAEHTAHDAHDAHDPVKPETNAHRGDVPDNELF